MYHYRKTRKVYKSYPRPEVCVFCTPDEQCEGIIEDAEHHYIVPNRTFYDVWEHRPVKDHLLVVPKRHTDSLAELEDQARLSIMNAIAKYETQGYNVYARAPGNTQKSVHHQHTHLIKVIDKPGKFMMYLRKPYFLIKL